MSSSLSSLLLLSLLLFQGRHACRAIGALANVGQIDSTITNFLVPLQGLKDKDNRVHCSLNLNTETGRLSSRRPNLQNQPALEKDQYKIRDAFIAEEGKTLIVADYGQLELRILASITNCQSMIDAFKAGGCFHSRTAVGTYTSHTHLTDTSHQKSTCTLHPFIHHPDYSSMTYPYDALSIPCQHPINALSITY